MNWEKLSHLVTVRNHLALLINTSRTLIPRDKVREYETIQRDMDIEFLNEIKLADKLIEKDGIVLTSNDDLSVNVDKVVVKASVETKPVEAKPVSKKKASKKKSSSKGTEDAELAKRLAEAKAQVADKKKSSMSVTKVSDDV